MKTNITTATALPPAVLGPVLGPVGKAFEEVSASFDRFCLAAGIAALGEMMEKDAAEACGTRHSRTKERRGYRWGRTQGKIAFHAGKIEIERPRVRDFAGRELALPSWQHAMGEDWLGKWAMNLMLLNVSTRKFRRAVRLPASVVAWCALLASRPRLMPRCAPWLRGACWTPISPAGDSVAGGATVRLGNVVQRLGAVRSPGWPPEMRAMHFRQAPPCGPRTPFRMPSRTSACSSAASFSIISPSAAIPAARQKRSKLAETSSKALPTGPKTAGGKAVAVVIFVFMALLSFPGISTPSLRA